ncbi:MAG: IS200/IS605 family transposase [Candidatus Omnitrophica bacterium]|nr:IS200/IS605 family transposase [Candidatus Omnitrophota bacterium]
MYEKVKQTIVESMKRFKERYAIEMQQMGFDQNHVHYLCRFLPKYSGGQVIRLIKSISARQVFKEEPEVKRVLWGGEFWTDGYYIGTISGHGDKNIIVEYIKKQGREKDIK